MNKTIRILLIVAVLAGVIAVAGSQGVWAGKAPAKVEANADFAQSAAGVQAGTVIVPPPAVGGGGDELVVDGLDDLVNVDGIATLLGMDTESFAYITIGERVEGFLSRVINLNFTGGSVRICFAAPTGTEQIYFNTVEGWQPTFSFYLDGQVCTITSVSGGYILGE